VLCAESFFIPGTRVTLPHHRYDKIVTMIARHYYSFGS